MSIESVKKVTTAIQNYLDALSPLDMENMKATVAMFTKEELQAMQDDPNVSEQKKAFLIVAQFLKGIQHVGQ